MMTSKINPTIIKIVLKKAPKHRENKLKKIASRIKAISKFLGNSVPILFQGEKRLFKRRGMEKKLSPNFKKFL
jgi:hypothetical protein